jgi:hypothetical protein
MVFDRIRDLISDPGSIGDKLGELGQQFGVGEGVQGHLQDQLAQFGGLGALQDQLGGITFPIGQDDLANVLEQRGVPTGVTDALHGLGGGQFDSPAQVMDAVRGLMR